MTKKQIANKISKLESELDIIEKTIFDYIKLKDSLCIELDTSKGLKYQSLNRIYFGYSDKISYNKLRYTRIQNKISLLIERYGEI